MQSVLMTYIGGSPLAIMGGGGGGHAFHIA